VFQGEVFFPAIKMPAGHSRAQIRTSFFTLDYQESGGKGQVAFATRPEVSTSRLVSTIGGIIFVCWPHLEASRPSLG
jgi:hypothetical protein